MLQFVLELLQTVFGKGEKKADALVLSGKPWEALHLYEEILQECPECTSTQQRVRALRE